jgi:hypothetical protein
LPDRQTTLISIKSPIFNYADLQLKGPVQNFKMNKRAAFRKEKAFQELRDMGIVNSSVSSSSATILSNVTPTSLTNTTFLSTAPTSIVAGVHTAEVISTWDSQSPMAVVVPAEDDHTHLQNGIISRRDEAEVDNQKGSAPTQYTSVPISLTKRDRLKDKSNNESPAIQRARQQPKGVTPPHLSLAGRRHVKEIPHPGHTQHHIYHMVKVSDPPEYAEEDTSHSNLQLTGKHRRRSIVPPPVSSTQQGSRETDTIFLDDVAPSDQYTTPFDEARICTP